MNTTPPHQRRPGQSPRRRHSHTGGRSSRDHRRQPVPAGSNVIARRSDQQLATTSSGSRPSRAANGNQDSTTSSSPGHRRGRHAVRPHQRLQPDRGPGKSSEGHGRGQAEILTCSTPATTCRTDDVAVQRAQPGEPPGDLRVDHPHLHRAAGGGGGISLLVGGIGVMNIMLVSVTERPGRSASAKAHRRPKRAILPSSISEAVILSLIRRRRRRGRRTDGSRFKIVGIQP